MAAQAAADGPIKGFGTRIDLKIGKEDGGAFVSARFEAPFAIPFTVVINHLGHSDLRLE